MSKKKSPRRTITTDLAEHPAVKAWSALIPERIEPDRIEVLKEKPGGRVYRLFGVGPGGSAVIAKQRRAPTGALVERSAYEDVFPRLPLPSLRYFGFVEDSDPRFVWIFLEDAGDLHYSHVIEEHRALAGRWLGCLHTCDADPRRLLPERRGHYLEYLVSARDGILEGITNPVLTAADIGVLRTLLSLLGSLESRWNEVEDLSGPLPHTVILGNFVPRNSLVRSTEHGTELLIVDCESLAWGNPVWDLAQSHSPDYGRDFSGNPDVATYFQTVRDHWPHIEFTTLQQLARYATVLRCIASISWEAPFLAMEWAAGPMASMGAYQLILPDAMRIAGWHA